jgi:hypothetical protein
MSAILSIIFQKASSVGGRIVSDIPRIAAGSIRIAATRSQSTVSSTSQRGNYLVQLVARGGAFAWGLLIFALGVLFWFLRIVLARVLPAFLKNVVDDWEENRRVDYVERRERFINSIRNRFRFQIIYVPILVFFGFFEFIFQFVGVVLYAFIVKWFKDFFIDRFILVFTMIVIMGIFFYIRTHLPGATSLYQETAIAGLETVNTASSIGNAAISANQIMMPLNNFMVSATVSILIQIEEGARVVLGLNGAEQGENVPRRMLWEDDRSAGEKFLELIINLIISFGYFFLQFILIVIKLFFLIIAPVLPALLAILEFFLYRLSCIMAGQFCGLLEILDAVVNLILGPFTFLFGRIDIACGANQLTGVRCDCAGWLWSFDAPGIYRKLEPCGVADPRYSVGEYESEPARRLLSSSPLVNMMVSCYKNEDGDYVEEIGRTTSISKTSDIYQACSVARRAFHPYTHAQDMYRFDTHDCITHCVTGVALISCDTMYNHTVSILGSCNGEALDEDEAKRRLAFLRVDLTMLSPPPRAKRRMQEETGALTRLERVERWKAYFPLHFSVQGIGECDLSSTGGFYELLDALICVTSKSFKSNANWKPWETTNQDGFRALQGMFEYGSHRARIAKHERSVKDVSDLYESSDAIEVSPAHVSRWDAIQRRSARRRIARRNLQGLVLPEEDEITFTPSASPTEFDDPNTEPVDPNDPVPCIGRILCPDQVTCVVDSKYCKPPAQGSPVIMYSYYMQQISSGLNSFDVYKFVAQMKKCYENRPFSRSPYNPRYVFQSYADKLRDRTVKFCPGEFAPTDLQLGTLSYKPSEDVSTFCTGSANFEGCRCPDFWDTRGTSTQYANVSTDWLYVCLNGFKWFLYVIWLMLNAIAGFVDSVLESAGLPNFTKSSTSAYGLTDAEFTKCVILHTGDAAALVIFLLLLWTLLKAAEYVVDWFMNWWNAGLEIACVPNPESAIWKLNRRTKYDKMLDEVKGKYRDIKENKLRSQKFNIEFSKREYKAALRLKRYLMKRKDDSENELQIESRYVQLPRKKELQEVKNYMEFDFNPYPKFSKGGERDDI